jgi:LysM repeat protein
VLPTPTATPPPPPTPTSTPVIYVVKAGDTVLAIALRYGVSQEDLLAANGMNADDVRFIQLGQQLVIPLEPPAAAAGPAPAAPVPAATTYTVRAGDTLVAIAGRLGIPLDALIAANGFTAEQVRLLRPGQQIIVPAPAAPVATGAAAAPTATPLPATSYTVRPGDTLLAISRRVGVSVEDILAANNMTMADATRLRPDQVLVIPGASRPAAATPTATTAAAAAAPPAAQPAAAPAAQAAIRLDAPQLRSFENGASVSCSSSGELTWLGVPYITGTDRYRLHLGFVSGIDAAGNVQVTWLIEQDQASANTAWQMDTGLCRFAPQDLGRQWRWYVEVVDANGTPVSLPSAIWGFSWN